MDVHVAARICSAAHGGQVVVSRATRDVAGDNPGRRASFRSSRQPPAEERASPSNALPARRARASRRTSPRSPRWEGRRCPRSTIASSAGAATSPRFRLCSAVPTFGSSRSPDRAEPARAGWRSRPPPRRQSSAPCTSSALPPSPTLRSCLPPSHGVLGVRELPGRELCRPARRGPRRHRGAPRARQPRASDTRRGRRCRAARPRRRSRRSRHEPRRRCVSRASTSSRSRRCRSTTRRRSSSSWPPRRASRSATSRAPPWRRSAGAWTACRWRSSSSQPVSSCSPRHSSSWRWTKGWRSRWKGRSTFPPASGHCMRRSNGATGC